MSGREHQDQDTEKYQKRLNQLYRNRKDIVEGIKDLKRRQRLTADKFKHIQLPQASFEGRPSAEELPKSQQSLDHPHLDTQQQEIKKIVEAQSGLKDRNKRLFGGLNKHLQKAQSRISEEQAKVRSKQSIEEKVLLKQREQAQQFQQQKKRQIEAELQRLTQAKENNSKEMLATENIILKNKFIAYVSDLEQFLFTKTQPSLAWKPNVQAPHNDALTSQHRKSTQAVKKQAEGILQQVSNYSQPFDFNTYRMENEREFYTNYLDNYFTSKLNFITTKSQPPIIWKPSRHNQNTLSQLQASKEASHQLRQAIAQENQSFYKRFVEKEAAIIDEQSEELESDH